jgi:hypothetical protein
MVAVAVVVETIAVIVGVFLVVELVLFEVEVVVIVVVAVVSLVVVEVEAFVVVLVEVSDVVVVVEVAEPDTDVVDVAAGTSMISSPSLFTEIVPFAFIYGRYRFSVESLMYLPRPFVRIPDASA